MDWNWLGGIPDTIVKKVLCSVLSVDPHFHVFPNVTSPR